MQNNKDDEGNKLDNKEAMDKGMNVKVNGSAR